MSTPINAWRSSRLIYRAPTSDDQVFISSLLGDAAAVSNASPLLPAPRGPEPAKQLIETLQQRMLGVIICLPGPAVANPTGPARESTIPIGTIGLTPLEPNQQHHRYSTLGMFIHPSYHRQGYGLEALTWVLHWGFRSANLHRIELNVAGWNTAAIALYEKVGFVLEGRRRQKLWFEGKWWDYLEYGMLDEEWRERQDDAAPKAEVAER